MSSFTRPLTVTKIDARLWKVERKFTYYIGAEDSNAFVVVPKNFTTDFASVPRFFWILIPPDGLYTQAAVLHDYTYHKKLYARKYCDEIFLEAMQVLKVGKFKRWLMYQAVRRFGWIGWNKHRRKDE